MAASTSSTGLAVSGCIVLTATAAFVSPGTQARDVSGPLVQKQLRSTAAPSSSYKALPIAFLGALGVSAATARRFQRGKTQARAGYTYDEPDWMKAAPSMPSLVTETDDITPGFPAYTTDKTPETCPQDCIKGTGGPWPENYWDPAGLSKNKTRDEILMLRAQELKHGRVAMLAALGWFHVSGGWHFIGDYANGVHGSDNPLVALQELPLAGNLQVLFTILCCEWLTTYVIPPPAEKPWDILGWTDVIGDEQYPPWKEAQMQELNNGRLAMVGIIGLIIADIVTGGEQYGQQVGQRCFGNAICDDMYQPFMNGFNPESAHYPVPTIPYKTPILYPGQIRLNTGLPLL